MSLFHSIVRGYRRLAAHLLAPKTCPICLDELPVHKLREATPRRSSVSQRSQQQQTRVQQGAEHDDELTFAKLACKHKFCADCIKQYTDMKIRAKEVDEDQLVCPVLSCKVWLCERDIRVICGEAMLLQFQATLKRKRDEKNPSARWCPRPGCEELIVCESMDNFTCPKCQTVGCFRCRGFAHRFWFCRMKEEDPSYLEWEKSVGDKQAVRPCPQCKMRIWKAEGCNHIKCTGCRFEFCWVCASPWEASHYACYELPIFSGPLTFRLQVYRALLYLVMLLIVVVICVFGINAFITGYMLIWATATLAHRLQHGAPRVAEVT